MQSKNRSALYLCLGGWEQWIEDKVGSSMALDKSLNVLSLSLLVCKMVVTVTILKVVMKLETLYIYIYIWHWYTLGFHQMVVIIQYY